MCGQKEWRQFMKECEEYNEDRENALKKRYDDFRAKFPKLWMSYESFKETADIGDNLQRDWNRELLYGFKRGKY